MAAAVFAASYGLSRLGAFEWPRRYDPLALPDLTDRPGIFTGWQMKLVDADAANCVFALSRAGVPAQLKPSHGGGSCVVEGAIDLARLSVARLTPEETRCAMAARLYMWERHVLQPAAQRLFNEPVAEILHFGSYSCRTKRRRSSMSEHATANAFDISGFKLRSGRIVSVKTDWSKATDAGKFLFIARDGLCEWFNLTLSPDYNADHEDHFHADMGWRRSCR
ncbi:MAG: extensin family protein [Rhizobiales bacterium]|nr:extensin family protein [Hyphomicrobiales bacterium]